MRIGVDADACQNVIKDILFRPTIGRSGRILKMHEQVRALIPRIVDPRVDGMVNKFSDSKLSREFDRSRSVGHSRIQPSGFRVFR